MGRGENRKKRVKDWENTLTRRKDVTLIISQYHDEYVRPMELRLAELEQWATFRRLPWWTRLSRKLAALWT